MTLHEAIEKVLREAKTPLKASEIAELVNSYHLYIKGDKSNVTGSQVLARVNKYKDTFNIQSKGISLHDIGIKPYRDFIAPYISIPY